MASERIWQQGVTFYTLRTEYATGGIVVDREGRIVDCPPIFRAGLKGKRLKDLPRLMAPRKYRLDKLIERPDGGA